MKLATRPDQRIGTDEEWDRAEADLETALKETGLDYEILPGEGAFYGPKLEFHLTGRDRPHLAVRHAPARSANAAAARRSCTSARTARSIIR